MKTYRIVRFHFKATNEYPDHLTGLTLEEAQAHCNDKETSSSTRAEPTGADPWFDGYEEEEEQ